MDNVMTYILDLKGNIDEKLKQIGISFYFCSKMKFRMMDAF